jgi:hypothetical protein
VVGLTSAMPLVSATFDDLGYASVGGRHLVVRGYADLEERKLYEEAFRDLRAEERELALEERRHHKTAVVLLHELAHTFGADHDTGADTIMNASYSARASTFSPRAREVMVRTLDGRLGRASSTGEPRRVTAAIQLPRAAARHAAPVVFYITPSGDVESGGKVLDGIDIDNLLEDTFARDRDTEIIIKRARKVRTSALERIADRAMAIGLTVSITMY